jgi:hypothetical protein
MSLQHLGFAFGLFVATLATSKMWEVLLRVLIGTPAVSKSHFR